MKKTLILMVALLVTGVAFGQKIKVQKGNFKKMKGVKEFNLVFDYSDLEIPKYKSEEAFLEDKMAKREKKKKGMGKRFKKSWFADRENRYEPKFVESFVKRFKHEMNAEKDLTSAKYTIKLHTTKLYPGYNVGIVRHNAEIDVTITIYETANPSKILMKGKIKDVPGAGAFGNDYNSGYRISECYAKLAKVLAKYIRKGK